MRLIDADDLRKNMEFICMGIMAGTEPYNSPLTEIDNAPTVDITRKIQSKLISEVSHNIARQFLEHNEVVPFWLCIGGIRIKEDNKNE